MPKYGYLIVEGPHDVEFTYRLLSPFGLERVQFLDNLDKFFHPLVPSKYPPGGDLQKRMSVPLFLKNQTHVIAIHSAIGDSRLVATVEENDALIDLKLLTGVGFLLDSDQAISAIKRYSNIRESLKNTMQFDLASQPGIVSKNSPNIGAFVLPDNHSPGTLENLLLKSAEQIYPTLLAAANNFVSISKDVGIDANELRDFNKPSGENKATVGAMANILRPGKALQVSIQDNKWLKREALHIPEIKAVQNFLKELFEIN